MIPQLNTPMTESEAMQLNPLVLAFVGDAVQSLYVRTKLVFSHSCKAGGLHKMAISEVKATYQCERAKSLMAEFSETELAVFKRARNSKTTSSAKNASIIEYKIASGLEAVIGFLYLTNNFERLNYILTKEQSNG